MASQLSRLLTLAQRTVRRGFAKVGESIQRTVVNTLPGSGERAGDNAGPRVAWQDVPDWLPQQVRDENFRAVAAALDEAGIDWWVVSGLVPGQHIVGVNAPERAQVFRAIASAHSTRQCYLRDPQRPALWIRASRAASAGVLGDVDVLQIGVPSQCRGERYDLRFGCELEFWQIDGNRVVAPRQNRAAMELSRTEMEPVDVEVAGRAAKLPEVFTRRMVDDITFDIDVVYTWVDSSDPEWREARDRVLASQRGVAYHPEATHAARFRSRDELRYSLRSLATHAPWVRRIFLVTNGQVPDWLDLTQPDIELVRHSDIFDDPGQLPTFNSNAIISRLHHIPGLSEHYIYVNDDVMLSRPVFPSDFFTPSGLAKVFPANNRRPFGSVSQGDQPHLNLTRNIRSLLERECGVTVSRAIWHTPHAQLRSVHFEMEDRFADQYRATWASRFRHHDDIVSDQLHHYYAQITGRAVVGAFRYEYLNLLDDAYAPRMQRLIRNRDRQSFCLNDAPVAGATPIPDAFVQEWLQSFFPIPSRFERSTAVPN